MMDELRFEEMKTRIYNHCDLGELKELEGSYITKVGYNDCTDVVEITGVKTTTNGTMEVSFQISDGLCYVHTGEGDKNGKTDTHESN